MVAALAGCKVAEGEPREGARAPAPTPRAAKDGEAAAPGLVVLELFTSQGCSSCPPADRLLAELAQKGAGGAAGAGDAKAAGKPQPKVVPMAFHVDYWDYLGWRDPFSSPAWSERQRQYAAALEERGVYTPQLVIGGRAHVVGSDRRKLASALTRAQVAQPLEVRAEWSAGEVKVTAKGDARGGELWLALWQDDLVTEVARGENRGERLRNQHVVRRLVPLEDGAAKVAIDPKWHAGRSLGGLVFAQRAADRAIVAAGELPAPTASPAAK